MIGLIIWNMLVSLTALYCISKYYNLTKSHALFLEEKEKYILKQSIEEHIRLLTAAIPKESDKNKRIAYITTRGRMLNIKEKLNKMIDLK